MLRDFLRRQTSAAFVVVLATASLGALVVTASPAAADVFTVTTTTDGGAGSLREAVETLAVNAGGDEVVLQAGATYTLTCAQGGALTHGNTPLTITGNGATITMEATCEEHVLTNGTGALVLDGVRIANVDLQVVGISGAVLSTGAALTLQSVVIENIALDSAGSIFGGPFDAGGLTTATNTTIQAITIAATDDGAIFGGVVNNNGATFTDSRIQGLTLTTDGGPAFGGIVNNGGGVFVRTIVDGVSITTGDTGTLF